MERGPVRAANRAARNLKLKPRHSAAALVLLTERQVLKRKTNVWICCNVGSDDLRARARVNKNGLLLEIAFRGRSAQFPFLCKDSPGNGVSHNDRQRKPAERRCLRAELHT
mmetsp:Transcript_31825/g.85008  ORF Transcript_31825/g.85008 Transcript_31825/m.85008 type:complete len:111 (-) Transcript_31825:155-487(-)